MKRNLFLPLLALCTVLIISSCSKSSPAPVTYDSAEGTWVGTYNNGIGGPITYFSLNFKAAGALVVHANNATTPDIANGTWSQNGDNITGSYTFTGSSAVYLFAGKYTSSQKNMDGTIGLQPSATGSGVFSITKN